MAGLTPFNRRNGRMMTDGFAGFYNMLDDFFNENWPYARAFTGGSFKVNIQENDKEYLVEAELPGVKKEQIDLDLNDGRLTISVKREESINEEKKNYIHRESRYASMSRSVYLDDAKQEGVKAKLDNGILSIIVPKAKNVRSSRKIEIE